MTYTPNGATMSYTALFLTNEWLSGTRATQHMTPNLTSLSHFKEYHGPNQLYIGNGKGISIRHIGSTPINSLTRPFHLQSILHVLQITKPLMSIQEFARDNNVYW